MKQIFDYEEEIMGGSAKPMNFGKVVLIYIVFFAIAYWVIKNALHILI